MDKWLESVYSDGTEEFVSSPSPEFFETVSVRVRMYADAPVRHVLLRSLHNGAERVIEARVAKTERGLNYFEAPLTITEKRIQYQFYLVCDDVVYFYTQRGITTYMPDHIHDFVLLADYVQPSWVKEAVFYQIFPERFRNGDPSVDVSEDELRGVRKATDWEMTPPDNGFANNMTFYGGDLRGIREKLPYLKELGVTALYLNPIFTAPSAHKYDCIDYFHVDPHFGGDEALAELSKAVHESGMRLILDISINHTGTAHRWFNKDGLFFDKSEGAYNNPESQERSYYFIKEDNSYQSWMGVPSLPTLNYTSEALRDIIFRSPNSVLKKWLKPPYSIDGWRFDVADVFARNDEVQLSHELWPMIRKSIREENSEAYILAEDWGDCAGYLQGNEWDAPMNYVGCGRVIRQFLGLPDLFMERNEILRAVPYQMTAEDLESRVMQHLAKLPYAVQENQFNLFDSHDVLRLHCYPTITPDVWRGAVIFQFMLPGAASIYYGDEAEIDGRWTGSDDGCRFPMPWSRDITGCEAYRVYRTMARMKAGHKALSVGGMKFLYAHGSVAAIARFYGNEAFVGVISTGDEAQTVRIPFGAIGAAGPKGDRDVFGKPLHYSCMDEASAALTVAAHQSYFIECEMKDS